MGWALATTIPNTERIVCVELKRLNIPHIWFQHRRRIVQRGRVVSRLVSAFPRYVFVPVESAWEVVRLVWRVIGLVIFGSELAVVPQREIDRLKGLGGGSDILPTPAVPEPFRTGERVHVGGYGPLAGHDAVYQEIATEGRVRLLFDWMGRLVPIDVDSRDVSSTIDIEIKKKKRRRRGKKAKSG